MKSVLIVFIASITAVLICMGAAWYATKNADLLVCVLMVKNEERSMNMTLQPLVSAGINQFLIYDTGSSDNTVLVSENFFKAHGITKYKIKHGPWIDFATSRNDALRATEQSFPHATFMLMLDAEWILHGGKKLLAWCKEYQNSCVDLGIIMMHADRVNFGHPRLMRIGAGIEFEGKIHERPRQPATGLVIKLPSQIYIQLQETDYGIKKSFNRFDKDIEILLQDFQDPIKKAHAAFMLAQTYSALQDHDKAMHWYTIRIGLQAHGCHSDFDDEEKFLAYLLLGDLYAVCKKFDLMLQYWHTAARLRPHRAEPLIKIAHYYFENKNFDDAYAYVKKTLDMPYPESEQLFVFHDHYNFLRYALAAGMAYMFQEYEIGLQASQQAIAACHDETLKKELEYNMSLYCRKLGYTEKKRIM